MPDMVDRPDVVRDNPNVPKYHSSFDLKEVRLTTEHFGYIKPHFVIDDVSSDDFDYRPEYRTRSYTLKAPLMQDVHRKLSYVKVDLPAILPLNFEKFYTNPVVGDDVPNEVGTFVDKGYKSIYDAVTACFNTAYSGVTGANNFTAANLTALFKAMIFGELFYSRGSLLSSLGSKISKQLSIQNGVVIMTWDELYDELCSEVIQHLTSNSADGFIFRSGSTNKNVVLQGFDKYPTYVSFSEFLSEIRSTSDWEITQFGLGATPVTIAASFSPGNFSGIPSVSGTLPYNFGRLCAYQLACAEYFTNDKVDHIYSAELYRQYIGSLVMACRNNLGGSSLPLYFTANGIDYQYDYLSGKYHAWMLNTLKSYPAKLSTFNGFLEYFISIYGYKRSLRYKDYFVSGRVRPLAVGSVDVSVNSNKVSVIDITRNVQVQRFLNAVNHSGRRLSNYIKTFFGVDIPADRHCPHWLADIDEKVYTAEVENTGVAQQQNANSVTATFTGNSGSKELHFYVDFPGYIIGLTSYDIERAYVDTIDRSFFVRDRFDMFIPELQFVGDQPIYNQELNAADTSSFGNAFAYQYRDMQYKLLYSSADGGFVDYLPGFGFLYNPALWTQSNMSPDFIRSRPSELDGFYLSLSGYSLASYFHFISVITNNVHAKRPMIANPKILE